MKGLHIYKASAGSGKTYTLALYYLSVILSTGRNDAFKEVLAMTFTNKAAGEMKSRILDFLSILSQSEESENKKQLISSLSDHIDIDSTVVTKRAKTILHSLLHNYSDFHILTLDKFMQQIIRSFSKELNFNPHTSVESDQDGVFYEVIDQLMQQIGTDSKLESVFNGYSLFKTESGNSYRIDNELLSVGRELNREKSERYVERLKSIPLDHFITEIKDAKEKFTRNLEALDSNKSAFNALLASCGIELTDLDQLFKKIEKSSEPDKYTRTTLELTEKQQAKLEDQNIYPQRTAKDTVKQTSIDAVSQDLINHSIEAQRRVQDHYFLKQYISALYSTAVISEFEKALNQFKKEQDILFFIDFNRISTSIIRNEPVPFIYERMGTRYKHILLDEFQDNSVRQWQNLLPLLVEALSKGGLGLIVGDDKQAIYRWRNGNAEQFTILPDVKLPAEYDQNEFDLKRYVAVNKSLPTNYRSSKTIVDFNNTVFEKYRELLSNNTSFNDVSQSSSNPKAGYVTISKTEKGTDFEQFNTDSILKRISNLRERGYAYKDICILVDRHKQGTVIADFLMLQHQIPVISSENLKIDKNPSVQFILHLLKHAINPNENIHRMAILKYFSQIQDLDYNGLIETYTRTEDKKISIDIQTFIDRYGSRINFTEYLTISGIVLAYIRAFKLDETEIHLQFFLNKVLEFEDRDIHSIVTFLEWWQQGRVGFNLTVPEETDAVNIMTIHKSKGLEFPVVILSFLDWNKSVGGQDWIDTKKDTIPSVLMSNSKSLLHTAHSSVYEQEKQFIETDQANMLYVALTRPISELHVLCGGGIGERLFSIVSEAYQITTDQIAIGTPTQHETSKAPLISDGLKNNASDQNQVDFSIEVPKNWSPGEKSDERKYGTLFHELIAYVDVPSKMEHCLNTRIGNSNLALKNRLKDDINRIINHTTLKPFFTEGEAVYAECAIMDKQGDVYRPDRVVRLQSKTVVLEFKTGLEKPEHIEQVEQYGQLLLELGEKNVELYLIYTSTSNIIKRNV